MSPAHHQPPTPAVFRRRRLLVGGVGVAAVGTVAAVTHQLRQRGITPQQVVDEVTGSDQGADNQEQATCADPSTLSTITTIGDARLIYDISGRQEPLKIEPGFLKQLTTWLADWEATSRYKGANEIWGYGAYVPKDDCKSWHAAGRAFDISRLRSGDNLLVSCRTDLWDEVSAEQRASLSRGYWTLAASLHLHFAYVLTHYFDDLHLNHIHVDNGVSGAGMSSFNPRSRVQNQAVQAISSVIWGRPGEVTGQWADAQTQVQPILDQLGVADLTKQQTWQTFLRASVARG